MTAESSDDSGNGSPPPAAAVSHLTADQLQLVAEGTLRQINHLEWLRMLAVTLEQAPARRGIAMTPFRAGAIERLRLVVKYIELLQRDARDAERQIKVLQKELRELLEDSRDLDIEEGR